MAACGWTPTIFAEPGSTHVDGYDVIQNSERLGAWHNWLRASRWALSQQSDLILTAQDDALFHPNSQEFIESIRWPRRAAFVSLYTPMHYTIDRKQRLQPTGVRKVATHNLWGALSLVWKPDTLAAVVNHPLVDSWLGVAPKRQDGERRDDYKKRTAAAFSDRRSDPSLIANIDTAIGQIVNALLYGMWFCDPSPVAHIAEYSSIGHGTNTEKRNAYRIADHGKPLKEQIL